VAEDSGKIAITKEVERAGTTFKQRYWVKTADVKAMLQKTGWSVKDWENTVKELGGQPSIASGIHKSWGGSSKNHISLEVQGVVAKMLGRKLEDLSLSKSALLSKHVKSGYEGKFAASGFGKSEDVEKTLVAMHAATQAAFEDHPTVKLYRGISGDQAAEMVAHAKGLADKGIPLNEATVPINLNPASSFSEDPKESRKFGPLIIKAEVPREAILMSYRNTPTLSTTFNHEKEAVVLCSGTAHISVSDLVGPKGKEIHDYFVSKGLGKGAKKAAEVGAAPAIEAKEAAKTQIAPEALQTPLAQKKGKGAVPEWQGKKTWRDLWSKWAGKVIESDAPGLHTHSAKQKVVDEINVALKKHILEHKGQLKKAQFKSFLESQVKAKLKDSELMAKLAKGKK